MKATDRFDGSTPEVRVAFLAGDDPSVVRVKVRSSNEPSPTFLRFETNNAKPAIVTLRVEQDAGAPPLIFGSDDSVHLQCLVGDSGECWPGRTCMPGPVTCSVTGSTRLNVGPTNGHIRELEIGTLTAVDDDTLGPTS